MKQTRTLQLDEDVLCVRYSPNQKLLAVSLLDCTVKIFYVDTLKVQWLCLEVVLSVWVTIGWGCKVALTAQQCYVSEVYVNQNIVGALGKLEFF